MSIKTDTAPYTVHDLTCAGLATWNDASSDPRPGVLVLHAWCGQLDFERAKAAALAELGYVGFAADLYGEDNRADDNEQAAALMSPLVDDRDMLAERLHASLEAMKAHPMVDATRTAAIGFCFGGLCAIDLARRNEDIAGVVSFHGLLHGYAAAPSKITPRVLALHGWSDPMAEPSSVVAFGEEMTAAKADWQLHGYGGVLHAFTNPDANDPGFGTMYDGKADRRSWAAMRGFLGELFG